MPHFASLQTPALLVDLDRMERNLDRAADYAHAHGLALRPHTKTHKSARVAREQTARGAAGLTCATPRELEVMHQATNDLLLAYPALGAAKLARVMALPRAAHLTVSLDSPEAVSALASAARTHERPVGVYIEADVGMHRVGLPSPADVVELARLVSRSAPLELAGLAFYPGHIREPESQQHDALAALARQLAELIAALRDAGLDAPVVSGGSTPTMWRSHEVAGVTEIRPGTYVYNDRTTAALDACAWDDCALTVLATVVSTAVPGQAVIDAGTKALGREPLRRAPGQGFGALLDRPDVVVARMSEEHGVLDLSGTAWRPRVGDLVRVVPNHVCIAVHLADVVYGVRVGAVVEQWPVEARGR